MRRSRARWLSLVCSARADACDPAAPVCAIGDITSNEPSEGAGNGDSGPDWEITGPLTANLRAERRTVSGRAYTLHVSCTDETGNRSPAAAIVTVPHDEGNE